MTVLEQTTETPPNATAVAARPERLEIVIVGAGFSGLAMADELRRSGRTDFVVLERAAEVGGTWRDNSYPGCACDVPSHLYSFSFAPNPRWTATFSPQPEIQAYLRRVAEQRHLLSHIRFDCALRDARWDQPTQRWQLDTSRGPIVARVLIAAAGPLSEPSVPQIPGIDRFQGAVFHSARWDHDHDLRGERVAVVGTGASSIQFVPQIQPTVRRLTVFQRTAPWIMPRRSRHLSRAEHAVYSRLPAAQRLMRSGIYWARELYALPLLRHRLAPAARAIALAHLRLHVKDPALRARLTPNYAPGCKRILISNDYLPAMGRDNVELVTAPITEVRERSIATADGAEHEVDTIVFGTGFHVSDIPIARHLHGRAGRALLDDGGASLIAHRGTTAAGFPNLFVLLGPNTGLGHTSVVVMAEAQADYVRQALDHMRAAAATTIEVSAKAQADWNRGVQEAMRDTVWTQGGCASWYLDASGVNTTLWPDFSYRFRRVMRHFDAESYRLGPHSDRPDGSAPATTPTATGAEAAAAAAPAVLR